MVSPPTLLEVWSKMEAVLAVVVVGVEGPSVAVVVVALPLEMEEQVAAVEAGVLVSEARFQTSALDVRTGITVVTLV